MSRKSEAKLFYMHEMVDDPPNIHHTVYSGEAWELPAGLPEAQLPEYIEVVCRACPSLADLVAVTRGMRPEAAEEPPVNVWCSLYPTTVVIEAKLPRYINGQARCRLIDERKLVKLP